MSEKSNDNKYKSYLQTISLISYLTASIEVLTLVFHVPGSKIQWILAAISIAVLFIFGYLGALIAGEADISDPINKFLKKFNKGTLVTVLFFTHLVCVSIFIFQDGGTQTSYISNILLLDASFGYFFAAKKRIKKMVIISCVFSYFVCFLFYFDNVTHTFVTNFTLDIIPNAIIILFVLGVNSIINAQITRKNLSDETGTPSNENPPSTDDFQSGNDSPSVNDSELAKSSFT